MNNQKLGIKELESVLNNYGIEHVMTGNKYPLNITNMSIMEVNFTDISAWMVEDFRELADYLKYLIEVENINFKGLKEKLRNYDVSNTEITGEYAKDSYRTSHASLHDLIMLACEDIKIAQDRFQSVFDTRASHEFKSTESAFLYKGYYITPCILRDIISLAWNDCKKEYQKEYLKKFYNGEKQNIRTIASDCLADMFNKDDISRLSLINDYKVMSVGV